MSLGFELGLDPNNMDCAVVVDSLNWLIALDASQARSVGFYSFSP